MSAIALVMLPQAGAHKLIAESLLAAMPYRAPDGQVTWSTDTATLAFGYTRTLPEDPSDAIIYSKGTLHLCCDVRFDNRAELLEVLALKPGLSDGEILLESYIEWGTACVEHLIGDFAFIFYEATTGQVFAGRDHMGVRPLFFRHDHVGTVIATEMRVLVNPGRPFCDLSENGPVAAQLADFVNGLIYQENTVFYEGVNRLPAGHTLEMSRDQAPKLLKYWEPTPQTSAIDIASAPETLRNMFLRSVEDRLRSVQPVAAMLSGGLDSTSVACAAARLLQMRGESIDTVSIVFDATPELNERPFIELAAKKDGVRPHFLDFSGFAPLEDLDHRLRELGRLVTNPGMVMTYLADRRAAAQGFKVILNGHGGDEVISHGYFRVKELAAARDWKQLWVALKCMDRINGHPVIRDFLTYFISNARFKGAHRIRQLLGRWVKRKKKTNAPQMIAQRLSAVSGRHIEPTYRSEAEYHLSFLRSTFVTSVLETIELLSASAGVQQRFPFLDIRIIEFSLALPSEMKMDKGWSRLVMRQAMEGILPPEIQWRTSKFDFTSHIGNGMFKSHHALLRSIIVDNADGVGEYINLEYVQSLLKKGEQDPSRLNGPEIQQLWRTVALSLWLRTSKKN